MKNLTNFVNFELHERTIDEVASNYSGLDEEFTYIYKKLAKVINNTSRKYYTFDENDICSFAMESLYDSLKTYDESKGHFATYFGTLFRNKLREEVCALNTNKRKALVDYSDITEHLDICTSINYQVEFIDFIDNLPLTESEKKYCKIVGTINSEFSAKELSAMIGVSVVQITRIKKGLQNKIKNYIVC